jgi:hypothetical protein
MVLNRVGYTLWSNVIWLELLKSLYCYVDLHNPKILHDQIFVNLLRTYLDLTSVVSSYVLGVFLESLKNDFWLIYYEFVNINCHKSVVLYFCLYFSLIIKFVSRIYFALEFLYNKPWCLSFQIPPISLYMDLEIERSEFLKLTSRTITVAIQNSSWIN